MNCLLCDALLEAIPTWGDFFRKRRQQSVCEKCMAQFERVEEQPYENVQALYYYNDAMQSYLFRYKFLKDYVVRVVFADVLRETLKAYKGYTVVPIPMHPDKKRERTFAHIDELLEAARVPYVHLLEKTTTASQSEKTKEQRENSRILFCRNTIQLKKNRPILIVDDIITTGTTIRHATHVLQQAGFEKIDVLVLISART